MKTQLVKIGNSQGIRIPRALIDQVGLSGQLELEALPGQLVIRPIHTGREGWADEFAAMAQSGDDKLLDGAAPLSTAWDDDEWTW